MIELFHPEILFSEDYYNDIHNKILVLSEKGNLSYNNVYSNIRLKCEQLLYKLSKNDFNLFEDTEYDSHIIDLFEFKDIIKLCFEIILNEYNIENKTYSDFNINIEYFLSMSKDYFIIEYKFQDRKLHSFKLKSNSGIEYIYDENYNITHVKFLEENDFISVIKQKEE